MNVLVSAGRINRFMSVGYCHVLLAHSCLR
jgi:hypothetical protein